MSFTGSLSRVINSKWLILTGEAGCIIATVLLAFADRPERYHFALNFHHIHHWNHIIWYESTRRTV